MAKRELTEQQEKFIEALLENKGDVAKAAELSGFSVSQGYNLRKTLKDAIIEAAKIELAAGAPAAVYTFLDALKLDSIVNRDRLEAAKQILDRSGVVKEEKQTIDINHSILVLPAKDNE